MKFELGLSSFAELSPIDGVGDTFTAQERINQIVEEIKLADKVGLDIYGLGEHHRDDYAVSDPVSVLSAAAAQTSHIRLSSAVTVLSSDDPVRVYQRFATLDALSNGRAEIMAGRGSFIESFPLFGYDLKDYDLLYKEKLDLLMNINENEIVNWEGTTRAAIHNLGVYPRAVQEKLPIWLATGGNPESSMRAGQLGLPITYAIIGGAPSRFRRNVAMYKAVAESNGFDTSTLPIASHSWGYVADTDEQARQEYYPSSSYVINQLGKERGWPEYSLEKFDQEIVHGAMFVGSPETVANKIIKLHEDIGINRFMLHVPLGSMPHDKVMKSIKLLGEKVKPIVDAYMKNKEEV
ncbi:LLM class flavin-dependent oxidoreductase [Mammaliicoccus stepanovicii]|uniref:N5, N10-methylenetetrahydromethanopterin reductase n=1 Tax=Mammaliicoccus stepanovicii TaxID=643214 RepID=A0A239YIF0_9STAP|nr:LLM class flavin-dependent oxidoreductase [Mammaliicoccus stepanovicii]PNZ74199.1 LLM class flavin-dependent oxidoreductase [Mammaliicoccus stepanovicii]GGI40891.1 N5,N10-methylene tetrahydromethanopterin reductase [Mammaliicoccus stepanovicii]SNV58510.1 N5, N10-methylenetetrahydromethanopterin reductase [Mammaliicoccus stepanovicii]